MLLILPSNDVIIVEKVLLSSTVVICYNIMCKQCFRLPSILHVHVISLIII